MGINQKKLLKISILLYAYLLFALATVICDYCVIFFSMPYIIGWIIAMLTIGSVSLFLIKRRIIETEAVLLKWKDVLMIGVIVFVSIIRIALPDDNFDSYNYHLYFQEFLNRDFVNYDFFPMRAINANTLVLGDRMFFAIRSVMGYRAGTFLNTAVMILLYTQIKQLLKQLLGQTDSKVTEMFLVICSCIALFTDNVMLTVDTYFIDLLAVPIYLEVIRLTIIEDTTDYKNVIYLSILAGISMAIKMSNAVPMLILAIIYIIRFHSKIRFSFVLAGILSCILIIGGYLWTAYRLTGNPVFPYVNGVFKSEYFSTINSPNDYSGFNERFGPQNIMEFLIWPVYALMNPEKTTDVGVCSGGLIVYVGTVLLFLFTKQRQEYPEAWKRLMYGWGGFYLILLMIFRGYGRYLIIVDVLGCICTCCVVHWWWTKHRVRYKIISGIIGGTLFASNIYFANMYFIQDREWAWRGSVFTDSEGYFSNLRFLFRDYDSGIEKQIIENIEAWIVFDNNASLLINIKDTVPIISWTSSVTNDVTYEMREDRINGISKDGLYTVVRGKHFAEIAEIVGNSGFAINSIIPIYPNIADASDEYFLIQVQRQHVPQKISVYNGAEKTFVLDINDKVESIFVGFSPIAYSWGSDGYWVEIHTENGRRLYRQYFTEEKAHEEIKVSDENLKIEEKWYFTIYNEAQCDEDGDWLQITVQGEDKTDE